MTSYNMQHVQKCTCSMKGIERKMFRYIVLTKGSIQNTGDQEHLKQILYNFSSFYDQNVSKIINVGLL